MNYFLENLNGNKSIAINSNAVCNDLGTHRDRYESFSDGSIVLTIFHADIQTDKVGIS